MLNAIMMGYEFFAFFSASETPATTSGYEGFFHCTSFEGTTEKAVLRFIIRDHDAKKFEDRKRFVEKAVNWLRDKYGADRVQLDLHDQYRNMADKLSERMEVVDLALDAMKALDIKSFIIPMRGGTDGAALSWRGL